MSNTRSEQELVRIEKLSELRQHGDPFPNDVVVTATSERVRGNVDAEVELDEADRKRVTLAGRLMTIRLMGKAAFCHVQDRHGQIQVYVKRDDLGEAAFERFKSLDLGDIIEVTGYAFRTKTNEPSLHAEKYRLLVKCLHPLPEKWHGLTDVETRYRKRYVDLIVNKQSRDVFLARAKILGLIREFFNSREYLEVETPMMHSVASGAAAKPFLTHHNSLSLDLYLRIAPELHLKRLLVGGFERVYEMGRVFRNEGMSTEHNPEFTILEFYQAYATYNSLMDLTEELIVKLCQEVTGGLKINYKDRELDFTPPWKRITMVEAIREFGNIDSSISLESLDGIKRAAKVLGFDGIDSLDDYGRAVYEVFDVCIEERIVSPTFITKHPLSISPLSRASADDGRFVDRFELIVAGMELANAFSELNDPFEQHRRLEDQLKAKMQGDEEAMDMDEDFVTALEYGMPPTAGEGIGIDRLVMILVGATSIRDVILFPQMRPLT
ncbi:MAG: lysine--tRNA ligase [Deltaproteobacteria bacterium]|nr:lysine--tRNA ligase [Deltaproteobacteria bacterium]